MTTDHQVEGDHEPRELEPIPHQGGGIGLETIKLPVSKIMRPDVGTTSPDATVLDCVQIMATQHYGCVLVEDGSRLIGILSERDVVTRVVSRGKDPATESVRDIMTVEPECVTADEEIAYALNIMKVGGFRHVPVVHPDGAVAGIISIRDVANLLVDHFRSEVLTLRPKTSSGPTTQHGG